MSWTTSKMAERLSNKANIPKVQLVTVRVTDAEARLRRAFDLVLHRATADTNGNPPEAELGRSLGDPMEEGRNGESKGG